jgi:hypothetical protein
MQFSSIAQYFGKLLENVLQLNANEGQDQKT